MTKKVQEKNGRDDFQLRVTRSGSSQAFRRSAESCVNEIARNEFRGEKCAKSGFLKWGALRRCHVFPPTPYQVVARNHFSCALRACKKIRELYDSGEKLRWIGLTCSLVIVSGFVSSAREARGVGAGRVAVDLDLPTGSRGFRNPDHCTHPAQRSSGPFSGSLSSRCRATPFALGVCF
jgi:hypothetical protein